MVIVIKAVKLGKAVGPFKVCAEAISTSIEVGVSQANVMVPIFEGKGDTRSSSAFMI